MHAWIKLIGTVNSYKQFHWCQQKLDRISRASSETQGLKPFVTPFFSIDSEQSLVCSVKMLQFTDFRAKERLLVPTLLKNDGLEVDPNTVLSTS